MRFRIAILALSSCAVVPALSGQSPAAARLPAAGGLTKSVGQPDPRIWTFGVAGGLSKGREETAGIGEARIGVYKELINPSLGGGGVQAELYNWVLNARYSAGVRLRAVSQVTGVAVGADYNAMQNVIRAIFTYVHPLHRGGLARDGSVMRVDVLTAPDVTMTIGFEKPFGLRIPRGKGHPLSDKVRLPPNTRPESNAPPPEVRSALSRELEIARAAAGNMRRLVVPWVDHTGNGRGADTRVRDRLETLHQITSPSGSNLNVDRETQRYHDAIDKAFSLALVADGASPADTMKAGRIIGDKARSILLAQVLNPYNFTLGQAKEDDSILGFADFASGEFQSWLRLKSPYRVTRHDQVAWVFDELCNMVEAARAATLKEVGTSRFVWLPLQFGLRLEDRDTQDELDRIIEQATYQQFTNGNHFKYIINEQFQYELHRTILAARNYHVLWTHDFRGKNSKGKPDTVGFQQVVQSYLAALTARVRAYDSTGTFPTYIILLDQWFYEVNNGRLWMNFLEDPTRYVVDLPNDFEGMEGAILAAQATLNQAIKESALLQAHAHHYGDDWLLNLVKVHVNITNASDPSFWSWGIVKGFPYPDTWMRDHRKIVFYDLSDNNRFSGEAILTGAGIGEHYVKDWEDRSLVVCGPVALRLKAAARDALMNQGMAAASIPAVLQSIEPTYESLQDCPQHGDEPDGLPAMLLQNVTGFDDKEVNVAKAVLYTLMPAGSVIKIPDSIWNGTFWGSALIGAALRGVRVIVIAPSLANAPARAFGSMVRSRELLWRLLEASRVLRPEIDAAGGMLRVGIFNTTIPVTDVAERFRALQTKMAGTDWLRMLFPFAADTAAMAQLFTYADSLAKQYPPANARVDSTTTADSAKKADVPHALLHLKANFFASDDAWSVMSDPRWVDRMRDYLTQRILQLHEKPSSFEVARPSDSTGGIRVQALRADTGRRVIRYTVLGSQNQNDRSMVSDGEVAIVLSAWPAEIPYLDMLMLVGQSEWLTAPKDLDGIQNSDGTRGQKLLPAQSALKKRLAHWFKHIF